MDGHDARGYLPCEVAVVCISWCCICSRCASVSPGGVYVVGVAVVMVRGERVEVVVVAVLRVDVRAEARAMLGGSDACGYLPC